MTECPSREHFERLLARALTDEEEDVLEAHLQSCVACQEALEVLTAAPMDPADEADYPGTVAVGPVTPKRGAMPSNTGAPAGLPAVPGYEILEAIGRGGMGVVYKALELKLNRLVALKMVLAGSCAGSEEILRFLAEAQHVAQVQHPNIVQVHGTGRHNELPYFVMEYVGGGSLADKVLGRPVAARQAARLVEVLAHAIHAAHQRGIIHRDLKPSNVLLQPLAGGQAPFSAPEDHPLMPKKVPDPEVAKSTGGPGKGKADQGRGSAAPDLSCFLPKITDFGLAKRVEGDSGLTRTGEIMGTPSYMAPEQARGKAAAVGTAADVYALGAILYELLTGRSPFCGTTPLDTLDQVLNQEPVPPSRLQPKLPRDIETICLKCLQKEAHKRYESAAALADDLHRFLAQEPIKARPSSMWERGAKWVRRRPALAASVSVLVLVLVVAAIGSSIAAWRFQVLAEEARQRGDAERWQRYRSNIAAAAGALELQNISMARRALDEAPPEHRNWEWQHFTHQLDVSRAVLAGGSDTAWVMPSHGRCCWMPVRPKQSQVHLKDPVSGKLLGVLRLPSDEPRNLTISDDCRFVASHETDGSIRLWDVAAEKEIAWLRVANERLDRVVFSPSGGAAGRGQAPFSASAGHLEAPKKVPGPLPPAGKSPDSSRSVAAWGPTSVRLWKLSTGVELAVLAVPGPGPLDWVEEKLAFSPDGRRIAFPGADCIRVWDTQSAKVAGVLNGAGHVAALTFSPDGTRLVSGGAYPGNGVRLWDLATNKLLAAKTGHQNQVMTVAFSPDGKRFASASRDQTVRLWDGAGGDPIATLRGHTSWVGWLVFSPDSARLVSSSDDTSLRLWDTTSGELTAVLLGHRRGCPRPGFSPDSRLLLSNSFEEDRDKWDEGVRLWDVNQLEGRVVTGHKSFVYDVAFSPDGRCLASAAWDGTVRLWDPDTGRQTRLLKHTCDIVTSLAFSPDGQQLASVTRDDTLHLWSVTTGTTMATLRTPTGDWQVVPRATFQPASGGRKSPVPSAPLVPSTLLASGGADGAVRWWNLARDEPAAVGGQAPFSAPQDDPLMPKKVPDPFPPPVAVLRGHEGAADTVAFSPDGAQLASAGTDTTVRLWDVARRESIISLHGHTDRIHHLAWKADSRLLASASADTTVRIWDVKTHESITTLVHGSKVYGLAFSPDGTRLAAGCADNTIRLWDTASWEEVAELRGHKAYVHAVAFSPDGTRLASASGDFTVRIWDSLPLAARYPSRR